MNFTSAVNSGYKMVVVNWAFYFRIQVSFRWNLWLINILKMFTLNCMCSKMCEPQEIWQMKETLCWLMECALLYYNVNSAQFIWNFLVWPTVTLTFVHVKWHVYRSAPGKFLVRNQNSATHSVRRRQKLRNIDLILVFSTFAVYLCALHTTTLSRLDLCTRTTKIRLASFKKIFSEYPKWLIHLVYDVSISYHMFSHYLVVVMFIATHKQAGDRLDILAHEIENWKQFHRLDSQ